MLVGKTWKGGKEGSEPQRVGSMGGSNEVMIPSGERTNPREPLLSLYEPVNRSFVVMLDAGVSELTGIPFIAGKSVTKVPGTSKVSKAPPGRRTKPKERPLATV